MLSAARDSQTESLSDLLHSALLALPPGPDPQAASFRQVTLWVLVSLLTLCHLPTILWTP